MIDKTLFANIRKNLLNYATNRRELIKISGDAEQQSKKAIFAFQRNDEKAGDALLSEALENLARAGKIISSDERLRGEGSYRAATEEFVESTLFRQCLKDKSVGAIKEFDVDDDVYIAGLCDVPGELYRYAIKSATDKEFEKAKLCYEIAEAIINELVDMNLTGYNRQKFDQAKQALHKLEQVVYELSLKRL